MRAFRVAALASAAALMAAPLRAQVPERFELIPVVPGARHDLKAEALLPPSADSAHHLRLYRIEASIEEIFKWYLFRLGGDAGDVVDSPTVRVAGITPITYHITFHNYRDECADSNRVASAPGDTVGCQTWRRGKDKRRSLSMSRLPWDASQWIADAVFTWFCRDDDGALRRMRVEIRDIGLKPNWKYYTPLGQIRIASDLVEPPSP
jgi:hypothetical protein